MSHDSRCYDLALVFLQDHYDDAVTEAQVRTLADVIQQAIEDWLESAEGPGEIDEEH